jgi:hypothetical protein
LKHISKLLLIFIAISLAACSAASQPAAFEPGSTLLVSGGEIKKSYSRADLEALPASQADFLDVTYRGVVLSVLLQDAGFDPQQVKAVKAVANDGFTVNYDPAQFLRPDFLVAYAQANGELTDKDGLFRIVLPGAEGKQNVRMLVEVQVIQ